MDSHRHSLSAIIDLHRGKALDKWESYISAYERLFESYRDAPIRLLEIGVQNGGSLEVWRQYFANAERIVGCDIDPKCAELVFDDEAIRFVLGDANATDVERRILNESDRFDIVIDDGSHKSGDIVRSFAKYFPRVKDGGLFVIEDLHCSYWHHFEGGLFNPDSSMRFLFLLADIVNFEHWGSVQSRRALVKRFEGTYHTTFDEVALAHVHSIEFQNSLCIIRKADPAANILSSRVARGTSATVYTEALSAHGMRNYAAPDQSASPWSVAVDHDALLIARTQEIEELRVALAERDRRHVEDIEGLRVALAEQERQRVGEIDTYQQALAQRDKHYADSQVEHSNRLADLRREYERRSNERELLRSAREQHLLEKLTCAHQRIKQLIEKQIERDHEYVFDMLGQPFEADCDTQQTA